MRIIRSREPLGTKRFCRSKREAERVGNACDSRADGTRIELKRDNVDVSAQFQRQARCYRKSMDVNK